MNVNKKSFFITGDIANDYFLVRGKRFYSDDSNEGTRYIHHRGGAWLIFEFADEIRKLKESRQSEDCQEVHFGYDTAIFPILPPKNNSFVAVSPFICANNKTTWRIDEFFGFGNYSGELHQLKDHTIPADANNNIFIIDDAGIEFAWESNSVVWHSLMQTIEAGKMNGRESLVICKKSGDKHNSLIFSELLKASGEQRLNLLTIISVNDIRRQQARISCCLSWEQSALDLVYELKTNPALQHLNKSTYLVVTFQSSGALFIVNKNDNLSEYRLIFDPGSMEGDDEEKNRGRIVGKMSFFTAALASFLNLARRDKHFQLENAVKAGLTAIRLFYKTGYIPDENGVRYPFAEVAAALMDHDFTYSSAFVPSPQADPKFLDTDWAILLDNHQVAPDNHDFAKTTLRDLAMNMVAKGPGILNNIPSARFGGIFTVDRREIEDLRNLRQIMERYIEIDDGKKPLSIAVFGPPGSGKSFAVEAIGNEIISSDDFFTVFNLSQFSSAADLIGALHQVRDKVLKKIIPLVFWDEFDSKQYDWLQYLLAPMQDGVFQEGQITHTIGKCIFVFAGGTSYTMDTFGNFKDPEEVKNFKLKKGPDFISRLNGYINILGTNMRQKISADYQDESKKWMDDVSDICYPIRRAVNIMGRLRTKHGPSDNIDWGLLNALINVYQYKHGTRSLTNLLKDLKQNSSGRKIQRSHLPSNMNLQLYFDNPDNFLGCMNEDMGFQEKSYEIAPLIHSAWMEKIDDPTNELSVEYSFLPVFIKESNMEAAKRIPKVLAGAGLKVVKNNNPDALSQNAFLKFIEDDNSLYINVMAEIEHEQWMDFYLTNGWEYAPLRNDYHKKHDCLKPYNELPGNQKDKDKVIIRKYPLILEKVGLGIARA
jgi:hypothetical protein